MKGSVAIEQVPEVEETQVDNEEWYRLVDLLKAATRSYAGVLEEVARPALNVGPVAWQGEAVAFTNGCSPEVLAKTVVELWAQFVAGKMTADEYQARVEMLGDMLGAASRSGELRLGYADDVNTVLRSGGVEAVALSLVLSYASCETGFASQIAHAAYDYETGPVFPGSWMAGAPGLALPDGSRRSDVMCGVMGMLGNSGGASEGFFSGTEGAKRLQYLVVERTWSVDTGSDEADGLGRALEAATSTGSYVADYVARDIVALVENTEYDQPGWHVPTAMEDSLITIMEGHQAGQPMLGSVEWPADLPDDFIAVRNQVNDAMLAALKDSRLTRGQQLESLNDIAFQLAKAEKPFKALFLETLRKVDIYHRWEDPGTPDKAESNYYSNVTFSLQHGFEINDVVVDFTTAYRDPRGAYFVLFHELGHAIDDVTNPFGETSDKYSLDGVTLAEAVAEDVRNHLSGTIASITTDADQQTRVIDAIMNHTTAELSGDDRSVLRRLQTEYGRPSALQGPEANVVSDLYGAVTANVIGGDGTGGYGHSVDYWEKRPRGIPSEFWAGYAANRILGGSGEAMTSTYLDDAYGLAGEMAEEMNI